MPDLKLGRLPGKIPAGLRDLTYYAAGPLPQAPASVAVPVVPAWGMDGNDTYGDCGVAGYNHGCMTVDTITSQVPAQNPSDTDVVNYYLAYTGGQDTGVVLSDFLSYVRQNGFFGHTLSAFAPVAEHDIPTLHFAVNAYGFAYTGISVTSAMQTAYANGKRWDMDDLLAPVVGGHCVPIVGYDDQYLYCITWGKVQAISYAAWHYMSDEAWAVIPGEFITKGDDGRGVNLAALQADLNKLAA